MGAVAALAVAAALVASARAQGATNPSVSPSPGSTPATWLLADKLGDRVLRFGYRTHAGHRSYALLLLPAWYGPRRHPALPLVICPHGRNTTPEAAAKRWNDLPTRGGFAVVLPAGYGRVLQLDSWGYPGQIADLARMPRLAERAAPLFRYRRDRIYGVGASMGGQEVLLLLAKYPHLLHGVIAFDPAVNLANRYHEFRFIKFGRVDRKLARLEVGGTPAQKREAYRLRSPTTYARRIAFSHVPLELWWSRKDQVIVNQQRQAGAFFDRLKQLDPSAPIVSFEGTWHHAVEDQASEQLPTALAKLGLMPQSWLVHDPLAAPRNDRIAAPVVRTSA